MRHTLIGGKFKNRLLASPKGQLTRPTTALLRKSVFDILRPHLQEAHFLDLFAGSGAMGLEALSQGASTATFVDSSKEAILCIEKNVDALGLEDVTTILRGDVLAALKKFPENSFDIVYADPPYAQAHIRVELLHSLDHHPVVKKGGFVLLEEEYPSKQTLPPLKNYLHLDARHFGKSLLHQYRRRPID